jgi:hypothetical protein
MKRLGLIPRLVEVVERLVHLLDGTERPSTLPWLWRALECAGHLPGRHVGGNGCGHGILPASAGAAGGQPCVS